MARRSFPPNRARFSSALRSSNRLARPIVCAAIAAAPLLDLSAFIFMVIPPLTMTPARASPGNLIPRICETYYSPISLSQLKLPFMSIS